MKIFGRDLAQFRAQALELYKYPWYFCKCLVYFRKPIRFIGCYIRQDQPPEARVVLRNGTIIELSDHPHDVITVFVIFVRKDYGNIKPGSVVIDVGANIGVFALYAAYCGASKVYAYEPNTNNYARLIENIRVNGLEKKIIPFKAAVTARSGELISMPIDASPYGAVGQHSNEPESTEKVATIAFAEIIKGITSSGEQIDLVKMDCEGGEYEAFGSLDLETFSRIHTVKMEYHQGPEKLEADFKRNGYKIVRHQSESKINGVLWAVKK